MGDRLDFVDLLDEGGWPYPDHVPDATTREPVDLRTDADDDLVALHALRRRTVMELSELERRALLLRFGLGGSPPMTMADLRAELGVSRDGARLALAGGLDKLRHALIDDGR